MDERVRLCLKAAGIMLLLAVPPVWPYGYYMLLRLVVCGVAFYTAYHLKKRHSQYWVALIIMGLLFNPILPIALPKALWVPIDLAGAILFFWLARKPKTPELPEPQGDPDE